LALLLRSDADQLGGEEVSGKHVSDGMHLGRDMAYTFRMGTVPVGIEGHVPEIHGGSAGNSVFLVAIANGFHARRIHVPGAGTRSVRIQRSRQIDRVVPGDLVAPAVVTD